MSILEQELKLELEPKLELEAEYKQLSIDADICREAIEIARNRSKEVAYEIQSLSEVDDTSQQQKIEALTKEETELSEKIAIKKKTLDEIENKILLAKADSAFQKYIRELWDIEEFYKTIFMNMGKKPPKLSYPTAPDHDNAVFYLSLAKDYSRIGREDIANCLIQLVKPTNYHTVFKKAKQEYEQNPDYNWGCVYSLCLDHGLGTEIDKLTAFEIDKKFAEQDHPLALWSVANEYFSGDIVECDIEKAIQLYRKAVRPEQQSFYFVHAYWGECLLDGENIEKNEEEALKLLNKADEQGCVKATLILFHYFSEKNDELKAELESKTVMENIAEADIMLIAAEMKTTQEKLYFYSTKLDECELVQGKLALADCYYYGYGVVQNLQQYRALLEISALMELPEALETLALHYQYGSAPFEANAIQSLTLYFKSLRSGKFFNPLEDFQKLIADNKMNLEFMNTAYELCKTCAGQVILDNVADSFVMGVFFQHGILIPKNIANAIRCFKKGADLGNLEAATTLIKLSLDPETADLIPITLTRKYFVYAYQGDIDEARQHYAHYSFLLQNLKNIWSTFDVNMPTGLSELIADYAATFLENQEQKETEEQERSGTAPAVPLILSASSTNSNASSQAPAPLILHISGASENETTTNNTTHNMTS